LLASQERVSFLPVALSASPVQPHPTIRIHAPNGFTIEIEDQVMESADVEGSMEKQLRWVREVNCREAVSSNLNQSVFWLKLRYVVICTETLDDFRSSEWVYL
jgi:hypothetical protein